jgi:hypothetical protein
MAFVHGKGTVVMIGSNDMSAYSNSVTFTRTADTHETTTFGKNSKTYAPGLKDATASVEGIYDNTAVTGPGAVFRPLVGAASVVMKYRPEGTATGRAEAEVSVLCNSYEESAPVNDIIKWTAEFQMTGDIDDTAQ